MKQWVKYHTETIDDPKYCSLTWAQRGMFDALLLLAGQLDYKDSDDNETGKLDTVENISFRIRAELSCLQEAVDRFCELKMTHLRKNIVYLTNYPKRQARPPSSKTGAILDRVKKYRAKKGLERNEGVTSLQSERNEGVTTLEENRIEEIRVEEKRGEGNGTTAPSTPSAPPKAALNGKTKHELANKPVEIMLFEAVTGLSPPPEISSEVIKVLHGRTFENTQPYFKQWLTVSGNRKSLVWLFEWIASGRPADDFGASVKNARGSNHATGSGIYKAGHTGAANAPKPVDPTRGKIKAYGSR